MKTNRAVGRVGAFAVVMLGVLAWVTPAGAVAPGRVEGHVRDAWGDPVAGGIVQRDWEPFTGSPRQETLTDAEGYYGFDNVPLEILADDGTWSMAFTKYPAFSRVEREVVPPLAGTMTVDATLLYATGIAHDVASPRVRTDLGDGQLSVVMESWAPRPGSVGGPLRTSCFWVELPGEAPMPADFVRTDTSGRSLFSWSTTVASGTPTGAYPFDHWAADCGDPSLLLSERHTGYYEVRNEALEVLSYGPKNASPPTTNLWVTANRTVTATIVVDGVERTERSSTGAHHAVPLTGLGDGRHFASIIVTDGVETVGPITFSWTVDAVAPALSGGTPQGVTGDSTPTITVSATDPSGFDPQSTQFVLTDPNGQKRYHRAPQPSSPGTYTWQIELPLTVAGPYLVTFQAKDGWGNYSDLTWSFEYRRLASLR